MKKSRYIRPIIILVVVIGAYHVLLFGLRPPLPPVPKTEVIWGDLGTQQPVALQTPHLDTAYCSGALEPTTDNAAAKASDKENRRVRFEYRPVADEIINTGNTAKITMDRGSTLTLNGETYALKQILFQKSDAKGKMAFYLVHHAADGKVAIVAVPLELSKQGNPTIEALWRYMPPQPGEHNTLYDIHVDINNLLPHDRTYYRYAASGSCSKNVIWLGLQKPVQITAAQVAKLDHALNPQSTAKAL